MIQRQKKVAPVFQTIPKWLGAFDSNKLTPNSPEFHYYASRSHQAQPVTLYLKDGEECRPITMYYDLDRDDLPCEQTQKDESKLKDFSYLSMTQSVQQNKISISKQELFHGSSWVKKYEPKRFIDLLTDELINRNVLTWLKSWDEIVFKKKTQKIDVTPSIFRRGMTNKNGFVAQEFNYKKLILLTGPPGCGKTTLARVLAKHCGYHWQEINASDERSGKTLIGKIDNLATNKTVGREQKPVCVIIDEVDGALDSDSNGIKEVLQYLQSGAMPTIPGQIKGQKPVKTQKKNAFMSRYTVKKQDKGEKQQRKTKIDRPVIFICNDPYVRGLKELRNKAIVVHFSQLQQDRVVKRLKEITEMQNIFIESELLIKICQMCNNDVRSSVGVLELLVKFKKQQGLAPRDVLNRLRFSFSKDTTTSTNEFLQRLNSSKISDKNLFTSYQYFLEQHDNPSLLMQTFYHNIFNHKHVFFRMEYATRLYREIVDYNVKVKVNHGQTDQFSMLPYLLFRIKFKPDEQKKIDFPSTYFERVAKLKSNSALMEKITKGIPACLRIFVTSNLLSKDLLYLFWLTMQTNSTREQQILCCVYKMLTYGIKLGIREAPNIFNPQLDQLLTFGTTRPEISLSITTRNLIQQNYQFLKQKHQLIVQSFLDGRQNYETIINQLKRNRRRNRQLQGGVLKYKYLQGTGTDIKYDIKIGYFFQPRSSV